MLLFFLHSFKSGTFLFSLNKIIYLKTDKIPKIIFTLEILHI